MSPKARVHLSVQNSVSYYVGRPNHPPTVHQTAIDSVESCVGMLLPKPNLATNPTQCSQFEIVAQPRLVAVVSPSRRKPKRLSTVPMFHRESSLRGFPKHYTSHSYQRYPLKPDQRFNPGPIEFRQATRAEIDRLKQLES